MSTFRTLLMASVPVPVPNLLRWKMNEGTGTTIADSSGNGDTGTLIGPPSWVTGLSGTGFALSFNGGSSNRVLATTGFDFTAAQSFSISIWFAYTSLTGNFPGLIAKTANNAGWGYTILVNTINGQIIAQINDGGTNQAVVSSLSSLNNGLAHHAVMTCNRTSQLLSLYVDGVLQGTASTALVGDLTNGQGLYLGTRPDTSGVLNFYTGIVDDVGMANFVFSPSQVKSLFRAGPK